MRNSHEAESAIAQALQALPQLKSLGALPPALEPLLYLAPHTGKMVQVSLRHTDGDGVTLRFVSSAHEDLFTGGEDSQVVMSTIAHLVDESERHGNLNFLALKLLRDRVLPDTGLLQFSTPDRCRAAIELAIQSGLLTTSKIPNPKNPQFPVTSVSLNREHPDLTRWISPPPLPSQTRDIGVDPGPGDTL